LSLYATGQARPQVSTLNSPAGQIVANAAVVPAGNSGGIDVYVTNATDVILDINGYFAPPDVPSGLAFYPLPPCRIFDSRNATGQLGGPALVNGSTRTIPVLQSPCNVPLVAQAYSLNATVVPNGALGYLTLWPAGQNRPTVSTLNALEGSIVANAAIIPAGQDGAISAYVAGNTDLVLDINGYFAPAGPGGLSFYSVVPCRISDSRSAAGTFGGPVLEAGSTRTYPMPSNACSIPSTAQAFSLNATVVPATTALGYLTLWPSGQPRPLVSTLNSPLGRIVANAAIVPAGASGGISAFVTDRTDLILDIDGYFAP
jgi:hypothetical protein